MNYVIVAVLFFVAGAITMFFVYRNNKAKFAAREKDLVDTINRLKGGK